jgi:hypothetical protein
MDSQGMDKDGLELTIRAHADMICWIRAIQGLPRSSDPASEVEGERGAANALGPARAEVAYPMPVSPCVVPGPGASNVCWCRRKF